MNLSDGYVKKNISLQIDFCSLAASASGKASDDNSLVRLFYFFFWLDTSDEELGAIRLLGTASLSPETYYLCACQVSSYIGNACNYISCATI